MMISEKLPKFYHNTDLRKTYFCLFVSKTKFQHLCNSYGILSMSLETDNQDVTDDLRLAQ